MQTMREEDQEAKHAGQQNAADIFFHAAQFWRTGWTGSKNWCPAAHINRAAAPRQQVQMNLIVKVPGNLGNDCTSQSYFLSCSLCMSAHVCANWETWENNGRHGTVMALEANTVARKISIWKRFILQQFVRVALNKWNCTLTCKMAKMDSVDQIHWDVGSAL